MRRYTFLLVVVAYSCVAPTRLLQYTSKTSPRYSFSQPPDRIIFLNAFDIASRHYRDNKEELFINLTDELLREAADRVSKQQGIPTEYLPGYTPVAGRPDSAVAALLHRKGATHAVVIDYLDVSFYQTRVDVTQNYDRSKTRTAYYDIISEVGYSLYTPDSLYRRISVKRSRFHSSRNVISGLLAAGPSIVSQKDDALDMLGDNLNTYLNNFFPGEASRKRAVFTGKEFAEFNKMLDRWDFDAALSECLRYVNDRDTRKAARASYNCAVLFEKKNQPGEALYYLRQSLSKFQLDEAARMMMDFSDQPF